MIIPLPIFIRNFGGSLAPGEFARIIIQFWISFNVFFVGLWLVGAWLSRDFSVALDPLSYRTVVKALAQSFLYVVNGMFIFCGVFTTSGAILDKLKRQS